MFSPGRAQGKNESERVSSSKCKLQVCYGPILFDVSTVPYGNEIKLGVDFKTIIEVIRAECIDDSIQYGCCFVGITPEQQFKISVYQIVAENANA